MNWNHAQFIGAKYPASFLKRVGFIWLLLCLCLGGYLLLHPSANGETIESSAARLAAADKAFVPIESVKVGQRVMTPDGLSGASLPTSVDPATWRCVSIISNDWHVQTLQPIAWIESHRAQAGSAIDLSEVVDVKEMGIPDGVQGKIESVSACPLIGDGHGRVVLTTVNHLNDFLFRVTLKNSLGKTSTLEVTGYHKIYSEDHGWVNASDLANGERVQTADATATVVGEERKPGTFTVYNMTVEGEHVYYVGDDATLVHNVKCSVTKPSVTDPKLDNIVEDLYKGTKTPNQLGTGSTADAIRNELKTGQPTYGTFHSQKGQQYVNALTNWLARNPNASAADTAAAQQMLNDLKAALAGN